ncbi:putative SERF-like protein [Haliotis rufescens]|uniref:putative SERF-like protein n=1 Tax=Haliotis rufescens TaxID=6454 RepID=UPI001EAF96F0|nr:putative SERF-like protein [Haliotis rufescens]
MTRGNQRDKAREKNMKKQQQVDKQRAAKNKTGNKGMSLEERRHRDAEIMRQKQSKKGDDGGSGGEGAVEGAVGGQ